MSVLDGIVARTRQDVARRKATTRVLTSVPSGRDFFGALSADGLSLIAEVKRRSPSQGALREPCDPAAIARIYAGHAAAILLKRLADGALAPMRAARRVVSRPAGRSCLPPPLRRITRNRNSTCAPRWRSRAS